MNQAFKIVHYVNQFFGGVGGEDKAMTAPFAKEGAFGPGIAIQNAIKSKGINAQIVATVICGDDYSGQDTAQSAKEVLKLITPYHPDIVLAGPAFNAGRYGVACGAVCKLVREKLGIPAVTGMYDENPGADMYRKHLYIIKTADSARGMAEAIDKMLNLAIKLAARPDIGLPAQEGYIRRGLQRRVLVAQTGAQRAVEMLLARLKGEPFETELHLPKFQHAKPPAAVKNLASAKIALVTDGGLVPKGNPDRIEKLTATRYGKYRIEGLNTLNPADWSVSHAGYDNTPILQDPHRLIPLDVLRDLEKEGVIGKVGEHFYSTCGCAGTLENCSKMGKAIATHLKEENVDAVILTAT